MAGTFFPALKGSNLCFRTYKKRSHIVVVGHQAEPAHFRDLTTIANQAEAIREGKRIPGTSNKALSNQVELNVLNRQLIKPPRMQQGPVHVASGHMYIRRPQTWMPTQRSQLIYIHTNKSVDGITRADIPRNIPNTYTTSQPRTSMSQP